MRRWFLPALALVGAAGCASLPATGPQDSAPASAQRLPEAFAASTGLPPGPASPDPGLAVLLARVSDSPDVRIAAARLAEARARLLAARASLLPHLSASGTLTGTGADGQKTLQTGVLGVSLEAPLDVRGASRTRTRAAQARAEEAAFNQDRISALTRATLADLYVTLRTAQSQIAVTTDSLESANDTLSLAASRQQAGLETGLGVAQATSNRDAIAARLPGFAQAETAARLGIEALIGDLPGAQAPALAAPAAIPRFDLSRAGVTPSQWAGTRADLAAAGRRLEAAGLDARAARLDRYPNVTLTALVTGTDANRGTTGAGGSLAASVLASVFDFGRLDALAAAAGAQAQAEAGQYRRLVLNGLSEVETQGSAVQRGEEAIAAQTANVASARDQARLARVRYTSGLSTFLDVLTAERAVYDAQSALVAATGQTAQAEVGLILALGY